MFKTRPDLVEFIFTYPLIDALRCANASYKFLLLGRTYANLLL